MTPGLRGSFGTGVRCQRFKEEKDWSKLKVQAGYQKTTGEGNDTAPLERFFLKGEEKSLGGGERAGGRK